jgi:hypothetical protein
MDVSRIDNGTMPVPYTAPRVAARMAYYESPVDGDSGSPCFFVVAGQARPVLICTASSALAGANLWKAADAIVAVIASIGGDTNIVRQGMGGFTDFMPTPPEAP